MAHLPAPAETHNIEQSPRSAARFLPWIVVGLLFGAFLLAPWSLEEKAHAVLHGICGQTPSHTLMFAGKSLPLDTRCVGIFLGVLTTFAILIGLGRWRAAGLPTVGAGVMLLVFLAAMAVDGLNSLFADLGRWHPYAPSNDLRLFTGWMTGVGLGTLLLMVTGMTLWERPRVSMRVLPNWWWPFVLLLPVGPIWLMLRSGSLVVFYPVSLLLIGAALTAFATLAVCASVMLRNRDNTYIRVGQISLVVTVGIAAAAIVLLGMAAGRFWLESYFHLVAPA